MCAIKILHISNNNNAKLVQDFLNFISSQESVYSTVSFIFGFENQCEYSEFGVKRYFKNNNFVINFTVAPYGNIPFGKTILL